MHESTKRLLDFARESTREQAVPVTDFAGMIDALGVSSAVMTNWKKRGVSKEGALIAEKVFGCSAHWLLNGSGNATADSFGHPAPAPLPAIPLTARTPGANYNIKLQSVHQLIIELAQHLQAADSTKRKAAAALLSDLALEPEEGPSIASMVEALLGARGKHAA